MCGIVGGIAQRNVVPILIEGLKRLEYRGYDSAGIAVINEHKIYRHRELGKVAGLQSLLQQNPIRGNTGIAHTRWATHGKPSRHNAHPHISNDNIAIVHNGIIENYQQLKLVQQAIGYQFNSETDTEVIVHQIHSQLAHSENLLEAVQKSLSHLEGAYALGVISNDEPETLIACRQGSPLVIGVGIEEYFIASDVAALLPVTRQFIFLEEGDIAEIKIDSLIIYNRHLEIVEREIKESQLSAQ